VNRPTHLNLVVCKQVRDLSPERGFGLKQKRFYLELLLTLLFTVLGFAVMGYHPGLEDDGVYLTAVKARVNPALFSHNAEFFQLQMQATVFDGLISHFVRLTGVPVEWAAMLWQFAALFVILWACNRIAALIFQEVHARWGAVAMVAAMFTLPAAGSALTIADQHLHPRNLATALILLAVWRVLDGKRGQAALFLIPAFLIHPIMSVLGMSFCGFLALALLEPVPFRIRALQDSMASAVPLGWVFAQPTSNWREAVMTHSYYFLYRWTWYEWLGALAPLVLFGLLWQIALRRGENRLARFALAVFAYGVFQQVVAMVVLAPGKLERLIPLQPMRYLQLVYISMALVAGGLLGKFVLQNRAWRWAAFLVLFNGSMFLAQWELMDDSAHFEFPWTHSSNPWLQAFDWVRRETPEDAYFALDPRYLAAPGEDFHSFRALAERSQLADAVKDAAVVTQVPTIAETWHDQVAAAAGWTHFKTEDFERLKAQFGVDWVIVPYPQTAALACRWHNDSLAVCQIP
jgi:hypothetical protein